MRHPEGELVGQGLASLGSALFGGMPATGAIARTAVNVRSGARTRLAAVTHAIVLLLVVLVVAGGAMIAGIPGALFAVPLAAFVNVVAVYLGRSRDGVGPPLRPEDVDLIWSTVPRSRRTPA